jgi:hypothetical protein
MTPLFQTIIPNKQASANQKRNSRKSFIDRTSEAAAIAE